MLWRIQSPPTWLTRDDTFCQSLRALVALGLGDDPRVTEAYESLLDLQMAPGEKPSVTACVAGPFGNWCAHKLCFKLEDRLPAEKQNR